MSGACGQDWATVVLNLGLAIVFGATVAACVIAAVIQSTKQ